VVRAIVGRSRLFDLDPVRLTVAQKIQADVSHFTELVGPGGYV
jgi:hypothetical protein